MINFFGEEINIPINDEKKYKHWIENAVLEEAFNLGDLNIIFCSDDYLLKINREYLNHNYYTDIVTFDYSVESIKSGDLFISVDRVTENAKQYEVSFDNELSRVIIHGVLHLIGYGDANDEDKAQMRNLEDKYLKKLASVK